MVAGSNPAAPTLVDRRDQAIIRLFQDTGARGHEIADLTLSDVDLTDRTMCGARRGRRVRIVPFGAKTAHGGYPVIHAHRLPRIAAHGGTDSDVVKG